jgi:hypothetical protein
MSKKLLMVLAGATLALALGSPGCGGGDSGGIGASGLDKGKKLTELTDDERKQLCDWKAQKYGGYGQNMTCKYPEGEELVIYGEREQLTCVTMLPFEGQDCTATVGDVEACTNAITCNNRVPSQCKPVLAC